MPPFPWLLYYPSNWPYILPGDGKGKSTAQKSFWRTQDLKKVTAKSMVFNNNSGDDMQKKMNNVYFKDAF